MSTHSDSDYTEVRAVPSVSRDRWLDHARKKLDKGYCLIVSDKRRNANFYLAGKGYETCQHKTALLLIKQGIVKKAGKHHLGTIYKLSEKAIALNQPSPLIDDDEEETPVAASETDYEEILDQLETTDEEEEDEEDEAGDVEAVDEDD